MRRSTSCPLVRAVFVFVFVIMLGPWSVAGAQSLIVGIPNAEATPKGAFFFTHESQIETSPREAWNTFQFLTYGMGHIGKKLLPGGIDTEIALSFVNFGRPATGQRTIAAGFKSVYELPSATGKRWELRGTFGAFLPISLEGEGAGSWLFSSASARLPHLRTRLTVGPTYGTPQLFGKEKLGMMAGIEQPLGGVFQRRLSVIADWYSGRHNLAAAIPALQLNLPREWIVIAGYKLPNRNALTERAYVLEVAGILWRPRGHSGAAAH
jgi:hypothetical protein